MILIIVSWSPYPPNRLFNTSKKDSFKSSSENITDCNSSILFLTSGMGLFSNNIHSASSDK